MFDEYGYDQNEGLPAWLKVLIVIMFFAVIGFVGIKLDLQIDSKPTQTYDNDLQGLTSKYSALKNLQARINSNIQALEQFQAENPESEKWGEQQYKRFNSLTREIEKDKIIFNQELLAFHVKLTDHYECDLDNLPQQAQNLFPVRFEAFELNN